MNISKKSFDEPGQEHLMSLDEIWFNYISNGLKIYEGRFYDEKRQKLKIGDAIIFECDDLKIRTVISNLIIFDNLEECITKLYNDGKLEMLLPNINNIDDAKCQ